MELADVAARAAGENFPVGSILFPRPLRPHVRALYCYARFVDELGDAYEGDRLAALDELEREVEATFEGEPTWQVMRNVQPTVRRVRPAARAVPAPDRGEPDRPAHRASTRPGTSSSTTASTPPTRAGASCSAFSAGSTMPGSSLRATPSAPACSSSTSSRTCRATSSSAASTCPRRTGGASATPPSTGRATSCARCSASRRPARPSCSRPARSCGTRIGGRARACRGALRPRRPRRARGARGRRLGRVLAAAAPLARPPRARGCVRPRARAPAR